MKYTNHNIAIPEAKREAINNKILTLINGEDKTAITKEDIFNSYTGIGGLHGLQRSDYDNYHQYSNAKKEIENGQFFTPDHICKNMVDLVQPSKNALIAELSCGAGAFINHFPNERNVYGLELEENAFKVAKYLYPDAKIVQGDLRYFKLDTKVDYVFGNPPFNLDWDGSPSQLVYCKKAAQFLNPGGFLVLLVPTSFLADAFSNASAIKAIEKDFNFVLQYHNSNDAFKGVGVANFETKVMVFQRKSVHLEDIPYTPNSFENGTVEQLRNQFIIPLKFRSKSFRTKLIREKILSSNAGNNFSFSNALNNSNDGEYFKYKKFLFELRRHKNLSAALERVREMKKLLDTQTQPANMEIEEWEEKKMTLKKILNFCRKSIKNQNRKSVEKIAVVKCNYGIRIKGYSLKSQRKITKTFGESFYSFIDLVANGKQFPNGIKNPYSKLIEKKKRNFELMEQPFNQLAKVPTISSFLDSFSFLNDEGNQFNLSSIQNQDLNCIFQKPYSLINWEQGCGKTVAGFAWYQFRKNQVKHTFIIGPALAINLTWTFFLKCNRVDFKIVKKASDLNRESKVFLINIERIPKLSTEIAKFNRIVNQKVNLIFDESDEISNYNSQRTRAIKLAFRKVRFKLLATGTTTRNSINELYPQVELLYNNSINMMCRCPKVYRESWEGNGSGKVMRIAERNNKYFNMPFPNYFGNGLFKNCFSPTKKTVFGIQKENQDIYQGKHLMNLVSKMQITRNFNEIAGEGKYKIQSVSIQETEEERNLWEEIVKEGYKFEQQYFNSTGNSKKDAFLRIVRQLKLLIKATNVPHLFKEYQGKEVCSKANKIVSLVESLDEQVILGCTTHEEIEVYSKLFSVNCLTRPLFIVSGKLNFKQRNKVIEQFKSSFNGILLCTQQSVKSSVNIPSCNRVIVASYPWNLPKLSQFFFRVIRFDSKGRTTVYFVNYENGMDQNLLGLISTKEKVNDFVKTGDEDNYDGILEKLDMSQDFFSNLMRKHKDEDGKVKIGWGEQKIAC